MKSENSPKGQRADAKDNNVPLLGGGGVLDELKVNKPS